MDDKLVQILTQHKQAHFVMPYPSIMSKNYLTVLLDITDTSQEKPSLMFKLCKQSG